VVTLPANNTFNLATIAGSNINFGILPAPGSNPFGAIMGLPNATYVWQTENIQPGPLASAMNWAQTFLTSTACNFATGTVTNQVYNSFTAQGAAQPLYVFASTVNVNQQQVHGHCQCCH
jgi:hypothetical protein